MGDTVIRINIPLAVQTWVCKLKGHIWTGWVEKDSTSMSRYCARCGLVETDTPPERKH